MTVSDSPSFKLLFDGLLVLAVNKNENICEFGVVNAPDHVLRIKAEKVIANGEPIPLPDISLDLPSEANIRIDAPKSAMAPRVQSFRDLKRPFRRLIGGDDPQDFRSLVDLEGNESPTQQPPPKPGFPH